VLSQSNVRRVKAGVSIEQLAESIAQRTLLQSLNVRAVLDGAGNETGMFEVPAGGRRYRALELLVKQKRMAKAQPVPCVLRAGGIAEDDSLAENDERVGLHPLDQFRAFKTLSDAGLSEEDIAARHFVSPAIVRQRLRLASVSPKLHEIYADDGMTLEQLMAFSVASDHARQVQVWENVSRSGHDEPYLAYLFRTINAAISPALASEFGLDAADTGLLASIYFLVFGLMQIPIGVFLDRVGPRRVQGVLLVIAAGGAALFGNASSFPELLLARAMIGLGGAGSLMAGLKAIVTWFPRERVALANGWMIMLGSLGAVTATAPVDWLLNYVGWRSLFEILTISTFAVSGFIYMVVPEPAVESQIATPARKSFTLWSVYLDPRFLRIAPLSATCIGSAWALQSLWASAWLTDVEGFDAQSRVTHMLCMAVGLSLGALLLGGLADRLRKSNIGTEVLLAGVGALFIVAQLALILRIHLPPLLPWLIVSISGASTVLSFAAVASYFPRELAARSNGALNLLHFGWAFTIQYGIGFIVGQWPSQDGHYPIAAYHAAFGFSLVFQAAALLWFATPWIRTLVRNAIGDRSKSIAESDRSSVDAPVLEACPGGDW
jgi:ParB/RepB/Spo0J family partition protein